MTLAPARSVLLVDDDPIVRRVHARALRWRGHEILEASSKAEGVDKLLAQRVDLVIVDFHLNDGTGLELAREVEDLLRDSAPPVILISAALEDLDEPTRAAFGAAHRKPVSISKLLDDIDRLTARVAARKISGVRPAHEVRELEERRRRAR